MSKKLWLVDVMKSQRGQGQNVEFKVECRIFNLHDDDNYIQLINILYRVEIFVENNKKRKQTKPKKKKNNNKNGSNYH